MTSTIGQNIEALCTEHGLDRNLIIEAMKDAVKAAARKQFRNYDKTGEGIEVDWNDEEGIVEISAQKTVVQEVENPSVELSLDEAVAVPGGKDLDLVALDDALRSLAEMDEQQARIVELRFFGGLSIEETAEVLNISPATVKRDWASAKAWLYRDMLRGGVGKAGGAAGDD